MTTPNASGICNAKQSQSYEANTMTTKAYHKNRMKKFKRLVADIPKDLYRLFSKSSYRKDAATDSEGLRVLLNKVLRKEQ